jgi:hypothetical protein
MECNYYCYYYYYDYYYYATFLVSVYCLFMCFLSFTRANFVIVISSHVNKQELDLIKLFRKLSCKTFKLICSAVLKRMLLLRCYIWTRRIHLTCTFGIYL